MMNKALKHAIVDSGKSQRTIARRARLHETQLSRYVQGWDEPDEHERKRFAKILKKSESELFGTGQTESAA